MSLRSTFSLPEEDEEPVGVLAAAGRPLTRAGGGGGGGEPPPLPGLEGGGDRLSPPGMFFPLLSPGATQD